jgi:hypothetical protein
MCSKLLFWTEEWHLLKGKLRGDQTSEIVFLGNRNCKFLEAIYDIAFVSW